MDLITVSDNSTHTNMPILVDLNIIEAHLIIVRVHYQCLYYIKKGPSTARANSVLILKQLNKCTLSILVSNLL